MFVLVLLGNDGLCALWIAVAPPQLEELRVFRRLSSNIHTARIDMSAVSSLWEERMTYSGALPIASSNVFKRIEPGSCT